MVSETVGYGKNISENTFKNYYLKNIKNTIERSKKFATYIELLMDNIGTSIGMFFEKII